MTREISHRQAILQALETCAGDEPVLVIHSSLPHLHPPAGVGKWDFLYALRALVDAGRTVALPAFTFSWCGGKPYHHKDSESEVGVLADWAMELDGFQRTPHPIYSYVVAGAHAEDLVVCANTTTFGDDSQLAAFERLGARAVMMGCAWQMCTQFHRYEEEARVPYRYFKPFQGDADFGSGVRSFATDMFVRDYAVSEENEFGEVVSSLRKHDAITSAPLWCGRVESASCTDIAQTCRGLLARDPLSLIENPVTVSYRMSAVGRAQQEQPLRVALLGNSNIDFIHSALEDVLAGHINDRQIEMYSPPYGQMGREIADPNSRLGAFRADYVFFLDRLEDLAGVSSLALGDAAAVEAAVDGYIEQIKAYREQSGAHVIVNRFALLMAVPLGHADADEEGGVTQLVRAMNRRLDDELGGVSGVDLFDMAGAAVSFGGPVIDSRMWFMGRFPFSDGFTRHLATRYCALVLALSGRGARLLVLDLDNTLWGGVLGEDGMAGLHLGGDYPGNAYKAFQDVLLRYRDRGVALAVCSKNDEDLALEAINTLPAMTIRQDQLVAHRINWHAKWENLTEICKDLGLGLESVLFVDDNPAERELMRQQLPGVKVIDLPDDPALYAEALLDSPWMECAELTAEDRKRVNSYRTRTETRKQRAKFKNLDDYYASLKSRLHIRQLDEANMSRAVQLINKTNQFNTTTRRYDRQGLEALVKNGAEVYVIGAEDRFNALENIGVMIVDWTRGKAHQAAVTSYLLSCRVLGRGIETGALYWLMQKARALNVNSLIGEVIESERNTPARTVFEDAGFAKTKRAGEWIMNNLDGARDMPKWLDVIDETQLQSQGSEG